jgi:hypothetical protein
VTGPGSENQGDAMKFRLLVCGAVAIVLLHGCSGVTINEEIVGTWANASYNYGSYRDPPAKIRINADLTFSFFQNDFDSSTTWAGTYFVPEVKKIGASESYQIHLDFDGGGSNRWLIYDVYAFIVLDPSYNVMEINWSETAYPSAIDPSAQYYGLYDRKYE